MTKKISIIIPLYNVENYIEELLKSVDSIKIETIEFIFVEDFSKDNTLRKLKHELKNFKNDYKLINNFKNLGAAAARNSGVKKSIGEYIFFLDADDWLDLGVIPYFLELIENAPDVDIFLFDDEKTEKFSLTQFQKSDKKMYYGNNINYISFKHFSACTKLYKREILVENPFIEGRKYEDVFLLVDIFCSKKIKILITKNKIYNYRYNSNSFTNQKFTDKNFTEYIILFTYIYGKCPKNIADFLYLRLKKHIGMWDSERKYQKKLQMFEKEKKVKLYNVYYDIWVRGKINDKKDFFKLLYKDKTLYRHLEYKEEEIIKRNIVIKQYQKDK